jgi:Ca2+-binding RTX toxin-like protein
MSEFFRQLVNRLRRGLRSGAAARRPRPRRPASLSLEALSERIVPTLTPVFNAHTGALTITGTNTADTGTMDLDHGNITLNGVGTGATQKSITSLTIKLKAGNDVMDLSKLPDLGVPVTIDGGHGNDTLTGTGGDDVIRGGSGKDTLYGGAGNDDLDGGLNADNLYGQDGNDTLRDGGGADYFDGGSGHDTLVAMGTQANTFHVTGRYRGDLNGESFVAIQTLKGGALNDTFVVNPLGEIDNLRGRDGKDTFDLKGGVVYGDVDGGDGVDHLSYAKVTYDVVVNLTTGYATNVGGNVNKVENVTGGSGNDFIQGDGGNNRLDGGDGDDALLGMDGDDTLIESDGSKDYFNGGDGTDKLVAMDTDNLFYITDPGAGLLNGQSFSLIENVKGGSKIDEVYVYQTGSLSGTLDLGGGVNSLDFSYWDFNSGGVTVDLAAGTATAIAGRISGVDIVVGSQANDTLTGNSGDNVLVGLGGDDVIDGGAGRDIVIGGLGADTVTGGRGEDVVIGGRTPWDYRHDYLKEMRSIWRDSTLAYLDRIDALRTAGLLDSSHVYADGDADTLTGAKGDDWFWGESKDTLTDFTSFKEVQDTETTF